MEKLGAGGQHFFDDIRVAFAIFIVARAGGVAGAGFTQMQLVEGLYEPFVRAFIANPTLDPWTNWTSLSFANSEDAFPYGWPLLLVMSLCYLAGDLLGGSSIGILGFYLVCDFVVFAILSARGVPNHARAATFYALLPTPVVALVFLGPTDFSVMAALMLAIAAIRGERYKLAGVWLGLAIGIKAMLLVAALAVVVFLYRSEKSSNSHKIVTPILVTAVLSLSPALYSEGFRRAFFGSDAALRTLTLGADTGEGKFLLLPLILASAVLLIWSLKRMNQNLLTLCVTTPLLLIALLPGAPLGWSLWSLPLLMNLVAQLPARFFALGYAGFWMVLIGSPPLADFGKFLPGGLVVLAQDFLWTTGLLILLVWLGLMWREFYGRSDFVKLRRTPALVLIAGDSGTGKDTLAVGLANALGRNLTVHISGDDFHLWDRGNRSWDFLTHLDPQANDLPRYFRGVLDLVAGKATAFAHYDHRLGRKRSSRLAQGREFVLASGLHALWSSDVNRLATLTIFLSMSNALQLETKVARDVDSRGHSKEAVIESMKARETDRKRYIEPQRLNADVVLHSYYLEGSAPTNANVAVEVRSLPKIFDTALVSELTYTCGLEADLRFDDLSRALTVTGSARPEMFDLAFRRIEPEVSKVLNPAGEWFDGARGIVQFVSMVYLADALRRERLVR